MDYSPHDLLPAPEPCTVDPPVGYFYDKVAKHLIPDVVRIMNNGLHIDLDKVANLETVLDEQLEKVATTLRSSKYIKQYLQTRYAKQIKEYRLDRQSKMRKPSYYLKPFKPSDPVHRSYFMHVYATKHSITEPKELLPTGVPSWPAKTVKKLAKGNPFLQKLVDKQISSDHPTAIQAMDLLALHKSDMYNKKYLDQIKSPTLEPPDFNPGSAQQKQELFAMLGIESETISKKTGNPSFGKKEIERIHNEQTNEDVLEITQALLDYSSAAVIRNNFIEAFYNYTVDSRLFGSLKLFGAKSFRLTSNNP